MVIGGAPRKEELEREPTVLSDGVGIGKGAEVLKSEAFWSDLKGFLVQRLKDEEEGDRVWGVFKKVVESGE